MNYCTEVVFIITLQMVFMGGILWVQFLERKDLYSRLMARSLGEYVTLKKEEKKPEKKPEEMVEL